MTDATQTLWTFLRRKEMSCRARVGAVSRCGSRGAFAVMLGVCVAFDVLAEVIWLGWPRR